MVTVNPVYKSHELDYVLKQSDMKALCVIDAYRDVDYLQIIRDLVPESLERASAASCIPRSTPSSRTSSTWGPRSTAASTACPSFMLLGQHTPRQLPWNGPSGQFDNNDVVMMQYTIGHHGLPQGRHAHPPQHPEQRLLHRRGPEARCRRPRVPAGAVLPLLRLRAGGHGQPHPPLHHDHRGGVRRGARASGPPQGEGHGGLRRAHHVHRRAQPPRLRHASTCRTCARASWPAAPARPRPCARSWSA